MQHGAPKAFISDQGREFVNDVNTSLFSKFKVKHMITAAYNPQTNGQAESANKVAKDRFRKMTNDHQDNWDEHLEAVQHSIN